MSKRRTERQRRIDSNLALFDELSEVLYRYAGERGQKEDALSVLSRIIRERNEYEVLLKAGKDALATAASDLRRERDANRFLRDRVLGIEVTVFTLSRLLSEQRVARYDEQRERQSLVEQRDGACLKAPDSKR